jgi:hypothetical protein
MRTETDVVDLLLKSDFRVTTVRLDLEEGTEK